MASEKPKHLEMLDRSNPTQDSVNESIYYDDRIVRLFALASICWGVFAVLFGIYVSIQLIVPQLGSLHDWLALGRVRPLHSSAALFAFAGNAIFAGVYYSTQRLCKAKMWSHVLSYAHFFGWQVVIVVALGTLPFGIAQSRPLAEFEWPIDLAIGVVWIVFFGINFFATLVTRRERYMHVSLWFYMATIICVGVLHVFNNLAVPVASDTKWASSFPVFAGVQDAAMQWWYGHNMLGFLLIVPILGLMYYFVPKASAQPIYSYKLCIVHFWTLIVFYLLAGPHRLHFTTAPEWTSSLGMVFAILLGLPAWAGVTNGWLTLRNSGKHLWSDPVLLFFATGLAFYAFTSVESVLLGIKSVAALTQYTDYQIAHEHAIALGWSSMIIFGMYYWLAPRIFHTKLFSSQLAMIHFWLSVIGILLFLLPSYLAGITQSYQWNALDENGQLVFPDFVKTLQVVVPTYWIRAFGGVFYLVGLLVCGVNFLLTWTRRPSAYDRIQISAAKLSREFIDPPQPVSQLTGVLEFAQTLDTWSHLEWHSRWERKPFRFAKWVGAAILLASAIPLVPIVFIRGSVPILSNVKPYTPLELAGREIYLAEGCYNCHTQNVRPLLADTIRFGRYSHAGEFAYDQPTVWGSHRVGPDLAREGGRQSNYWHYYHLIDPKKMSAGSIMPSFSNLADANLDFKAIRERVKAAEFLGARYESSLDDAESVARQQALEVTATLVQQGGPVMVQNKKIIALIAYLQRLGTDGTRLDSPGSQP